MKSGDGLKNFRIERADQCLTWHHASNAQTFICCISCPLLLTVLLLRLHRRQRKLQAAADTPLRNSGA
jgi:hypothetical protein